MYIIDCLIKIVQIQFCSDLKREEREELVNVAEGNKEMTTLLATHLKQVKLCSLVFYNRMSSRLGLIQSEKIGRFGLQGFKRAPGL